MEVKIPKDLEKELLVAMNKKVKVDKKYGSLKEYIPALLHSVVVEHFFK